MMLSDSGVHSTAILSSEFFYLYDQLEEDASSLESSTKALNEAKCRRDETQSKLRSLQRQLVTTRAIIKEQKDRIALVMTHWFYGTTLFQPQLWLRGGCQGKIQRAQVKLEKAQDQDLPQLMAEITVGQDFDVPQAQAAVEEHLARFDFSANAASGKEVMRQRVFAEYPSQQLFQLQQQEDSLERNINNIAREIDNLQSEVLPKLIEGQQCYHKSKKLLEESLKRNAQFQHLLENPVRTVSPFEVLRSLQVANHRTKYTETRVPNGTRVITIDRRGEPKDILHIDRQGNILSTNFPCPNRCGFLITTHATHCCHCCSTRSGNHGPRCQRKLVASQQCAQTKLNNLRLKHEAYHSDLARENEFCNSTFTHARQEAKAGERSVREGLLSIASSTRERYYVVCQDLQFRASPAVILHSTVRADNINQELTNVVENQLLILTSQISAIETLLQEIRQDGESVQHQLQSTRSKIESEQNRIFRELRERVLISHDDHPAASSTSGSSSFDGTTESSYYERPPAYAPHTDTASTTAATATPVAIPSAPVEEENTGLGVGAQPPTDYSNDVPIVTATLVVD